MRVLILGARGMLGHALVRAFIPDDVIAWDQQELDITDTAALKQRIPAERPDVVMNAAAYTNVELAEEQHMLASAINGTAVGELAAVCAQENIPLVHFSTDYVFGNEQQEGYAEDAQPKDPVNIYGQSKLLGESLLQERCSTYWLVRTAWLFGPHGKNFVDTMLRIGKENEDLRVVNDQHGSPTYTEDLALAVRALVQDHPPYGVYHLTNTGQATWADLAAEVFRAAKRNVHVIPIRSEDFPTKAKRAHWSLLKNTKRPSLRTWQEAVQAYVRHVYSPPK